MLDLSKLKSAKVIDDPVEVAESLMKAAKESEGKVLAPQTTIQLNADGALQVNKRFGESLVDKAVSDETLQEYAKARGIPWLDEYAGRGQMYWASDERVDRHGDIVLQNWDFGNFDKNSVMLYSHDWDLPPIGTVLSHSIEQRSDRDYKGDALQLTTLFATKEQWEWADTIHRLVKAKFMKSGSVGFYPGVVIWIDDDDERQELGLGRWGYIYDKNELIEWSPCTIPANPGAHQLQMAKSMNLLMPNDVQVIREMRRRSIPRIGNDSAIWQEVDAALRTTWKTIFPELNVPEHKELDVPILSDELKSSNSEESLNLQAQLVEINNRLNALTDIVNNRAPHDDEDDQPESAFDFKAILDGVNKCNDELSQ